jgi:hypothetical protein
MMTASLQFSVANVASLLQRSRFVVGNVQYVLWAVSDATTGL